MNLKDRDRARRLRSDEPVTEPARYGPPHARPGAGVPAPADGRSAGRAGPPPSFPFCLHAFNNQRVLSKR